MVTSDEALLATYTGPYTNSFAVTNSNWHSEALLPVWPGGVQPSFWSITKVNFYASQASSPTGTFVLGIYEAASDGKPVAGLPALASVNVTLADVPTTVGWLANPVSIPVSGLNPAKKYCLVWKRVGGTIGTINLGTNAASTDTSFDYSASTNSGGTWTLNTARDVLFEVYGSYDTGAAGVSSYSSPVAVDGTSSPSLTFDIPADANRHLSVFLTMRNTSGTPDAADVGCTGLTCDGVAMARAADSGWGPTWERVLMYSLPAPHSGAGLTIAATLTGTYWVGEMVAVSSLNVNQTAPVSGVSGVDARTGIESNAAIAYQLGDLILDGVAWTGAATASPFGHNTGLRYSAIVNTNNGGASGLARAADLPNSLPIKSWVGWDFSAPSSYAALAVVVRGVDNPELATAADVSQFPKPNLRRAAPAFDQPDNGPL